MDKTSLIIWNEKFCSWKQYIKTKDAKIYQDYWRLQNQVQRSNRKLPEIRRRILPHILNVAVVCFKTNFTNSKMKLIPSTSQLFLDEKARKDVKLENDSEKAEVLDKCFQVHLLRSQTGFGCLGKKYYLKMNI